MRKGLQRYKKWAHFFGFGELKKPRVGGLGGIKKCSATAVHETHQSCDSRLLTRGIHSPDEGSLIIAEQCARLAAAFSAFCLGCWAVILFPLTLTLRVLIWHTCSPRLECLHDPCKVLRRTGGFGCKGSVCVGAGRVMRSGRGQTVTNVADGKAKSPCLYSRSMNYVTGGSDRRFAGYPSSWRSCSLPLEQGFSTPAPMIAMGDTTEAISRFEFCRRARIW